jgi:cell division protein FtsW
VSRRFEWHLLSLVTLGLVAFGLVMVYSATSAPAVVDHGNPMTYLERQGAYALIGLALMTVAARFDYRRLRMLAPALVLTALVLCLAVLVVGTRVNGAKRWLGVGSATFQPSELAKLALAVWAASYLARRKPPQTLRELARPVGLLCGLFCVLVLAEPDLGTAIVLVTVLAAILVASGVPLRPLAGAGTVVASVALLAIWLEPYRRARLFSFLDPWKDPQGAGFQTVQALIALASGGPFGVGLGQGVQKVNYLPEAHTDMILGVVGEELGLVGVTLVITAYAVFAYAGLRLALSCKDPFGKRLAVGLVALVCGQAAINLAAVVGLAPLTGIPLPFISYGGSSLVVALLSVGILLNIAASDGRGAVAEVPDRRRGDGRPRAARTRDRRRAAEPRRARDVRRVAGSRRGAAGS